MRLFVLYLLWVNYSCFILFAIPEAGCVPRDEIDARAHHLATQQHAATACSSCVFHRSLDYAAKLPFSSLGNVYHREFFGMNEQK